MLYYGLKNCVLVHVQSIQRTIQRAALTGSGKMEADDAPSTKVPFYPKGRKSRISLSTTDYKSNEDTSIFLYALESLQNKNMKKNEMSLTSRQKINSDFCFCPRGSD